VLLHRAQPRIEAVRSSERIVARAAGIALRAGCLLVGGRISEALAQNLRRHSLRHFADHAAVLLQELRPGLALNIDKTRRDNKSGHVDTLA
jgi:hypothetical protein